MSARRASRFGTFVETAEHDFLHAGGFLVIGAATAASLQTLVPRSVLDSVAGRGVAGCAGPGRPGRDPGHLLGGGRLRGRQPDAVLAHGPAGVHGRRPDGRRQTRRPPSRDVRSPIHVVLRTAHVLRRRRAPRSSSERCCCEHRRRRHPHRGHRRAPRPARRSKAPSGATCAPAWARGSPSPACSSPYSASSSCGATAAATMITATTSTAANGWRGSSSPQCWRCCSSPPEPLGAYSLGRTGSAVTVRSGGGVFAPLDPQAGPHEMSLLEFDQRAFEGTQGASFNGATVRLVGFVGPGRRPKGSSSPATPSPAARPTPWPLLRLVTGWDGPGPGARLVGRGRGHASSRAARSNPRLVDDVGDRRSPRRTTRTSDPQVPVIRFTGGFGTAPGRNESK